jgi:superfamily II DNA or RNA helicase
MPPPTHPPPTELLKIGQNGYTIPKTLLSPLEIATCKGELTVETVTGDRVRIYRENSAKLYVPKFYGIKKFGPIPFPMPKNKWRLDHPFKGELRSHQIEPIKVCLDILCSDTAPGGLLQLYCGAGKTTCALYLISKLKVKTLVIVHKEFLMAQWRDAIAKFIPTAKVGKIQKDIQDTSGKQIVLGMLKSIAMKDYPASLFAQFDFIIVDECHFICSKTFSNALFKMAGSRYSLGLSATPNRKDALEKIFFWHLGPVMYAMKREKVQCNVMVFNYQEEKGTYTEERNARGDIQVSAMMTQIISNQLRNRFVAKIILETYLKNPERKILVLSERRTHLETLLKCLKAEKARINNNAKITCGFFYGGLSEDQRNKSSRCNIILGTFQMASVGLDIDGLNTLVLASSKPGIIQNTKGEQISGSMEQSVGRIFRKSHSGGTLPLIIDIADKFSIFSNQAYKRIVFYKQCEYNVESVKVRENQGDAEIV